MEMCGSRPYRVYALEALGAVQVARDPVSSTDVPYPSSTSRIAGPPTSRQNSDDGGILVERLARRDRPDHPDQLHCEPVALHASIGISETAETPVAIG